MSKDNEVVIKSLEYHDILKQDLSANNDLNNTYYAEILDSKLYINDIETNNLQEEYPFLKFKDIVYLPLTRHLVYELRWTHKWDNEKGLEIVSNEENYIRNMKIVDDWIYFTKDSKLYKMRKDGSEKTLFTNVRGIRCMKIYNGWIYYTVYYTRQRYNGIYKIKLDGTNLTKLIDGKIFLRFISNKGIYYKNLDEREYNAWINRIDFNGQNTQRLLSIEDNYESVEVRDDGIYYIDDIYNNTLYKLSFSDNERVILGTKVNKYDIIEDWIYFSQIVDNDDSYGENSINLYKVRKDGSKKTLLIDEKICYWDVIDDWVYYINVNDDRKTYRVRTDGRSKMKLNDEKMYDMKIIGDNIYYKNSNDKSTLYKIGINGNGKVKLNDHFTASILFVDDKWVYYKNWISYHFIQLARVDHNGKNTENILPNGREKFHYLNGELIKGPNNEKISDNKNWEKSKEEITSLSDAVVLIKTFDENDKLIRRGSGVAISSRGLVVTNYDTIENGSSFSVTYKDGKCKGQEYFTHTILNTDKDKNLALIESYNLYSPFIEIGNSKNASDFQNVYLIGNSKESTNTFLEGMISKVTEEKGKKSIEVTVRNEKADIDGAVINIFGELIGIIPKQSKDQQGIKIVIPSEYIDIMLDTE